MGQHYKEKSGQQNPDKNPGKPPDTNHGYGGDMSIKGLNTKSHIQYKNSLGENVVGVTTVINVLDKPLLLNWVARITKEGHDWQRYRDAMGEAGSLTHLRILHYLKGTEPDLSTYSPAIIKLSDNSLCSFYEWVKSHKLEPIALEVPWVSDRYNFGGTPDFVGLVNGRLEILDFKTGGLFLSVVLQLAAYRQLAQEKGHKVEHCRALSIPRSEGESFREELYTKFDDELNIFLNCLSIYTLLKKTGRRL